MENAILVRHLDIIKIEIDFSDINNICSALNASSLSTIHTAKTQELSNKLGVHLMGFVDRNGDDINNEKACSLSGYDYIGSFMLLCKTDRNFNPLPLSEKEVNLVFDYLNPNKEEIKQDKEDNEYERFCKEYGFRPVLPNSPIKLEFFRKEGVPYVLIARYNFNEVKENDYKAFLDALYKYSSILIDEFKDVDGVKLSSDGKYYLHCYNEDNSSTSGYNYIFIQVNDDSNIIIKNPKAIVDVMFNGIEKEYEHVDLEDALEETL